MFQDEEFKEADKEAEARGDKPSGPELKTFEVCLQCIHNISKTCILFLGCFVHVFKSFFLNVNDFYNFQDRCTLMK